MPFKSKAQQGYMESHKKELEKKGVNMREFEKASKGMKLPNRVPKVPPAKMYPNITKRK